MKFFVGILLAVILLATPIALDANNDITVFLDGTQITFDVPPQNIGGRVMVPLRAIFEAMDAKLEWEPATQTATATRGDVVVIMQIGNYNITVSGITITLDVPPLIVEGRTLVPVRAVAESFNAIPMWDDLTQTVTLISDTPPNYPEPLPPSLLNLYDLRYRENFWIEVNGTRYYLGDPLSEIITDIPVAELHANRPNEYLRANSTSMVTLQVRDAENRMRGVSSVGVLNFANDYVLFRYAPVTSFRISASDVSDSFEIVFINDIRIGQTTRAEVEAMFGTAHEISETAASVVLRYIPFVTTFNPNVRDSSVEYSFTFDRETNILTSVYMVFRRP